MGSLYDELCSKQLIKNAPSFLKNNIHYEVVMGSVAYGVADDMSDMDVYGFAIPPKRIIFPHTAGHIHGYGKDVEKFEQYQKHHIKDAGSRKEYDVSMYNIVKFFNLAFNNNPNMVDALFVPTRCVIFSSSIGEHVRDNRRLFLSKHVWHKFKGYAFSQLHKMKNKYMSEFANICVRHEWEPDLSLEDMLSQMKDGDPDIDRLISIYSKIDHGGQRSKRIPAVMKYGYDVKFAYHVVRLLDECQMILEEEDLDLTRSREHLKAIRRGEYSMDSIIEYFDKKMIILEDLYHKSKLRYSPDEEQIKKVLMECLEMHYGDLSGVTKMSFEENQYNDLMLAYEKLGNVVNNVMRV